MTDQLNSERVIARDDGFHPLVDEAEVTLAPDTPLADLATYLDRALISIDFPAFTDGRGFSLARRLRELTGLGLIALSGAITAALFLRRFTEGAGTYVHFDIYGWQPSAAPGRMSRQRSEVPVRNRMSAARAAVLITNATSADARRPAIQTHPDELFQPKNSKTASITPVVTPARAAPISRASPNIAAATKSRAFSST